jgi:hypothetical protein
MSAGANPVLPETKRALARMVLQGIKEYKTLAETGAAEALAAYANNNT